MIGIITANITAWCALSARVDAPAVPNARLSPIPRAPTREHLLCAAFVSFATLVRGRKGKLREGKAARQDDLKRNVACTVHHKDLVSIGKNPATGLVSDAARARLAEHS